jgi:predicted O-methyltransferase YrrM
MLGRLFVDLLRPRPHAAGATDATPPPTPAAPPPAEAPTLERIRKLTAAAEHAPIARHLEVLYGDVTVAGRPLLGLVDEATARSATWNPPAKSIHRRERTFNLAKYFLHATTVPGRWAECGVFNGCSALALCLAARSANPAFDGTGLHLVDSFAGLSAPRREDFFDAAPGGAAAPPLWPAAGFKSEVEQVRATFAGFPGVAIHQGWIPQALGELPDAQWSFVHVDVDLYEPTRGCLEYFLPRLAPGGVIVCDDYGSLMFPGAERAWDEACRRAGTPFVLLSTGQAVIFNA